MAANSVKAPQAPATGFDGTKASPVVPLASSSVRLPDLVLRVLVLVMTFIAAIVMGTAKQTVTTDSGEDQYQYSTFKATGPGMSQLKFFVAANVIVFLYASVSLALTVANRGPSAKMAALVILAVDVLMLAFLLAGIGSASAMAVFLRKGSETFFYIRFCDLFGKMCRVMDAAIVLASLGATALVALVLLSIFHLRPSPS